MSDRIEMLAEQCRKVTTGCYGFPVVEFDERKFVELIVKECANVGLKAWLKDNSTVPTFPSEQIKQHFDVE